VLGVGGECSGHHTLTSDALGLEGDDQVVEVTKVAIVDDQGNEGLSRLGEDSVDLLEEVVEEETLLLALPAHVAQVEAVAKHQAPVGLLLADWQRSSQRNKLLECLI